MMLAGAKLFLDTSYNQEYHRTANRIGVVVACCDRPDPKLDVVPYMNPIPEGMVVWYNWTEQVDSVAPDAYMAGRTMMIDGNPHIFVHYAHCFCYISPHLLNTFKGNLAPLLVMLNGYILGEPMRKAVPKTNLILPESVTRKESDRVVRILNCSSFNKRYDLQHNGNYVYAQDEDVEVKNGDVVIIDNACNIPVEGDYVKFIADKPLYRFQRRYISAVIDGDFLDVDIIQTKRTDHAKYDHGLVDRDDYRRQQEADSVRRNYYY
jgi:hypothetical protein